jgi:hypothetical protein
MVGVFFRYILMEWRRWKYESIDRSMNRKSELTKVRVSIAMEAWNRQFPFHSEEEEEG